ncbi:MAG: RNA 2'-phosphotransferase [Actinocatenispora sp.]
MDDIRASKKLAQVLRHAPDSVGVTLDEAGWVPVDELLAALSAHGWVISAEQLQRVVASSDKQRYALRDGRIRANQGHSVPVRLGLEPVPPPAELFHGTVAGVLADIRAQGLLPRSRHHVHLSSDRETATKVGARRGRPVILTVAAGRMADDGHRFYRSDNGVWLADHVPSRYLDFPA